MKIVSKRVGWLHLTTLMASSLFLLTWPFLTRDYITSLAFLIPMLMASRGLRARKPTGLLLAALCLVAVLWNGSHWVRYSLALIQGQAALPAEGLMAHFAPWVAGAGSLSFFVAVAGMVLSFLCRNDFSSKPPPVL